MANKNFIPGINRRQLMVVAAATGIAPNFRDVHAGRLLGAASPAPATPGKPPDLPTLAFTRRQCPPFRRNRGTPANSSSRRITGITRGDRIAKAVSP